MNDDQGKFSKAISLIHKLEDGLLFVTTSAIVFFAALQIILRNFFDSGIVWIAPFLGVLVFWVGMLGALVATREHGHIKINVLSVYMPHNWQILLHVITNLFSGLISLLIAYYAVKFVQLDLDSAATAFADVPVWITEIIMPFTFLVMGVRFLFFSISHATSLLKLRTAK